MSSKSTTTTAKFGGSVGGQMPSKFIVQMSSYHYRHRQNWTNVLQTLPPKANVLQPLPSTTARISQMSSYHCRQVTDLPRIVLQPLPPKGQLSSNHCRQKENCPPTTTAKAKCPPTITNHCRQKENCPLTHLSTVILHARIRALGHKLLRAAGH